MTKVSLAIKLVIFSVFSGKLKVFLPNFVLPTGTLEKGESPDAAAERIFGDSSGLPLRDSYLEQLYTFSLKTEIIIAYYALMPEFRVLEKEREKGRRRWVDYRFVSLDFSDLEIIDYAVQRLRWKIEYTNVVYSLLPREFTFSQLQNIYEAILGRELDKRNFRKKILSLNILKSTGRKKKIGRTRPAEMYSFRKRRLTIVEIL